MLPHESSLNRFIDNTVFMFLTEGRNTRRVDGKCLDELKRYNMTEKHHELRKNLGVFIKYNNTTNEFTVSHYIPESWLVWIDNLINRAKLLVTAQEYFVKEKDWSGLQKEIGDLVELNDRKYHPQGFHVTISKNRLFVDVYNARQAPPTRPEMVHGELFAWDAIQSLIARHQETNTKAEMKIDGELLKLFQQKSFAKLNLEFHESKVHLSFDNDTLCISPFMSKEELYETSKAFLMAKAVSKLEELSESESEKLFVLPTEESSQMHREAFNTSHWKKLGFSETPLSFVTKEVRTKHGVVVRFDFVPEVKRITMTLIRISTSTE